jgi:hypothetical protein
MILSFMKFDRETLAPPPSIVVPLHRPPWSNSSTVSLIEERRIRFAASRRRMNLGEAWHHQRRLDQTAHRRGPSSDCPTTENHPR